MKQRIWSGLIAALIVSFVISGCSGSHWDDSDSASNTSEVSELNLAGIVTTQVGVAPGATDGTGSAARFNLPEGITSDGTNIYVTDSSNNIIRKILISTGEVTTLAGMARQSGATDGTGSAARFSNPTNITTDGINLYVADSGNYSIRKIVISTAEVTTLAGGFTYPRGIATDGINLYAADGNTIRQVVISTGAVTTLAGTTLSGSTDGIGAGASFNCPGGITRDGDNLYVADANNHAVRQIVISTGAVTTLAVGFSLPQGITTDGINLYVADGNTIRQVVISTGAVATLAGSDLHGSTDGTGAAARFYFPHGITRDGTNLYVADTNNNSIRQIVISTKVVTTLAGVSPLGSTDGTGAEARFYWPQSITTDGTNIYVADMNNHTIRKMVISTGEVSTLAGTASQWGGSTDGTGAAAVFRFPRGITTDGTNLYVADSSNRTIRKIVISTAEVTTLAGTAGQAGSTDGIGAVARFDSPRGITTDGTNLYVADSWIIRKIVVSTGEVTTLAGTAGQMGSTDGIGAAARFHNPVDIATDGINLYVADFQTIRKIVISTGEVTTLAGTAGQTGSTDGTGAAARFNNPYGITTDGTNLYVADTDNYTIRKIVISTGVVTTLAGVAGESGSTEGTGAVARFISPVDITTDGQKLYVLDSCTVREIQ